MVAGLHELVVHGHLEARGVAAGQLGQPCPGRWPTTAADRPRVGGVVVTRRGAVVVVGLTVVAGRVVVVGLAVVAGRVVVVAGAGPVAAGVGVLLIFFFFGPFLKGLCGATHKKYEKTNYNKKNFQKWFLHIKSILILK